MPFFQLLLDRGRTVHRIVRPLRLLFFLSDMVTVSSFMRTID